MQELHSPEIDSLSFWSSAIGSDPGVFARFDLAVLRNLALLVQCY
jgi:hypothetical protein